MVETLRITHCPHSYGLIRPGLCYPCVGHNERKREELSSGILSNPGDSNYHSGGISFAVGTLILQHESNQQQSILLCECFPDVGEP